MVIFPEPQKAQFAKDKVSLRIGCTLALGPNPDELELHAAELIRAQLQALGIAAGGGYRIVLGTPKSNREIGNVLLQPVAEAPNADQAYVLRLDLGGATLAANEPIGVLNAAHTLVQLLAAAKGSFELPLGEIIDWPEMEFRGIFAESRWCSELMTLQDWKDAIDLLASLKFNVFNIGIANNWMIQYEGRRSEFLLVPIKKYPQLKTPKAIEYYSPRLDERVRMEYLPKMFEQDFFGQVVAYGRSRGVTVRPHFNTPGHNTLIPHKIPEIGAVDEKGQPTGYGFCFSHPKTYEVMFDIFDEIVDRYLAPNGVHSFHVGLDEVYPLIGIDESEPTRSVSPYCQCDECKKKPWDDQFIDYVVALAKHLADKGVDQISMWHDSFVRGGKMNDALADRFREEGLLDKVVLHWWCYSGFFNDIHPELGVKRWVVPMTGYYYWSPYQDHLANIYQACQVGHEQGAEGAESYSVFNRAFYRNYACLSEYSWKKGGGGDLDAFRDKYTRFLFAGNEIEGRKAFRSLDLISGPLSPPMWAIYHYTYAYAHYKDHAFIKANYPQAIIEQIRDNPVHVWALLRIIYAEAQAAKGRFDKEEIWSRDPADLWYIYPAECDRIAASASLFLTLGETVKAYRGLQESATVDSAKLEPIMKQLDEALERIDAAMARIENDVDRYLSPAMLREMTLQRDFLLSYGEEIGRVAELAAKGDLEKLPDLESLKCREINWIG